MVSYAAQVGLLRRARPFKEIEVSSVDGFQAGAVIGIGSIRIEGAAAPLGPVAVAPAPPARVCGRERRKSGGREGSRSPPPPSSISADSRDNTPLPPRRRSRRTTLRATTARHIRPPRCASELCSERRLRSTPLSPSPTNHQHLGRWRRPRSRCSVDDGTSRRWRSSRRCPVTSYDEGREKEVIVISTVRANAGGHVGFLSDWAA